MGLAQVIEQVAENSCDLNHVGILWRQAESTHPHFTQLGQFAGEIAPSVGKRLRAVDREDGVAVQGLHLHAVRVLAADILATVLAQVVGAGVEAACRDSQRQTPEHLHHLLLYLAPRVAGESEYEALAGEAETWIHAHLGEDYPWEGNVRELEQCVRNIMVRQSYRPVHAGETSAREELAAAVRDARLTHEELLRHYYTLVYGETLNYREAARKLDVDARTVRGQVDPVLLERYRADAR